MLFVFGTRLFGKVDSVPGHFHVATKFAHIFYLPLIPLGSFIVLKEKGDQWQGVPISFCFKSFCVAWLRQLLLLSIFVFGFGLLLNVVVTPEHTRGTVIPALAIAVSSSCLLITYKAAFLARASSRRAQELVERVTTEKAMAQKEKTVDKRITNVVPKGPFEKPKVDRWTE